MFLASIFVSFINPPYPKLGRACCGGAVGLYVWRIIGHYVDHLPLYRREQIAARDRVILSSSTLADWGGRIGVALQPRADRRVALLLERNVLQADETPVAPLDPGQGKTKRAYLWAYRSNVLETGPPRGFDSQIPICVRNGKNVGAALAAISAVSRARPLLV